MTTPVTMSAMGAWAAATAMVVVVKGGGEGEGGGDGGDAGGGLAHEPTQPLARQAVVLVRPPLAAVRRQAMRSLKSMSAAGSSAAG